MKRDIGASRGWSWGFVLATALLGLGLLACHRQPAQDDEAASARRPQQAGQSPSPVQTAARLAAMRAAALAGDQQAVEQQFTAMHKDLMRAMKVPDSGRRIDPEAGRAVARSVPGVRSVVWVDRSNLLAIVEHNDQRSMATIDAICLALEPLGDTLAVVVNLQSGAARTGDELAILSRNCQLVEGDRALLQAHRQLDVVPADIRAQQRAEKARLEARADQQPMSEQDRDALMAIPEI